MARFPRSPRQSSRPLLYAPVVDGSACAPMAGRASSSQRCPHGSILAFSPSPRRSRIGPYYLVLEPHAVSTVGTLELFAALGALGWLARPLVISALTWLRQAVDDETSPHPPTTHAHPRLVRLALLAGLLLLGARAALASARSWRQGARSSAGVTCPSCAVRSASCAYGDGSANQPHPRRSRRGDLRGAAHAAALTRR